MVEISSDVSMQDAESFVVDYLEREGVDVELQEEAEEFRKYRVDSDSEVFDFELDGFVVGAVEDSEAECFEVLTPGSRLFNTVIEKASELSQVSTVEFSSDTVDVLVPKWIPQDAKDEFSFDFTPYYDRSAVVFTVLLSIETVSEFETEELHTVAVDLQGESILDGLEEMHLREVIHDGSDDLSPSEASKVDEEVFESALDIALEELHDRVEGEIDERQRQAGNAANLEFDEYRELQRQRLHDVEEKLDAKESRKQELTETIEDTDERSERLEALRKQEELEEEIIDIREELNEIRGQFDSGFPDKHKEILDRHALSVKFQPRAATLIRYEKGDLAVTSDRTSDTLMVAYASGAGVTEEVDCPECGRELSEENLLTPDLGCTGCSD